jgi:hypothetical protein
MNYGSSQLLNLVQLGGLIKLTFFTPRTYPAHLAIPFTHTTQYPPTPLTPNYTIHFQKHIFVFLTWPSLLPQGEGVVKDIFCFFCRLIVIFNQKNSYCYVWRTWHWAQAHHHLLVVFSFDVEDDNKMVHCQSSCLLLEKKFFTSLLSSFCVIVLLQIRQ